MLGRFSALVLLVAGCGDRQALVAPPPPPPAAPVAPFGDAARGRALVARFQCNRCHEGPWTESAALETHCVHCHQRIRDGSYAAPEEALAEWRGHIHSLMEVPSLTAAAARLRPEWIAEFLVAPHELRPHLDASMPRLAIEPSEARDIAALLVEGRAPEGEAPAREVGRGRALLGEKGCLVCHAFSGVPPIAASPLAETLDPDALARGVLLAPDLRRVRDRFRLGSLVAWIRDPQAIKPDSAMPAIAMSAEEASQIAAYIAYAPLEDVVTGPPTTRLSPLTREVTFDEVQARIFRRVCWHCHSDPSFALGDGGAGNTGGFGFAGRRLSLADYPSVMSGALDDEGHRASIFRRDEAGVPRIVAVLLARHEEVAGRPVPGIRGMPLGLTPIPLEDIQLLDTWIAQGRSE